MRGWQDFTLAEVRAQFPNAPHTNDDRAWHEWVSHQDTADRNRLLTMVEWDGIASDSTTAIEIEALDLFDRRSRS
jgi:hypothetical protein